MPIADWKDLLIGALALPLVLIILQCLRDVIQRNMTQIRDATAWLVMGLVTDSVAVRMSLARYCRTSKDRDDVRFLHVPGVEGASHHIGSIFVPLRLESGD